MATFKVTQRRPCWVTYTFLVEADNYIDAGEKIDSGDYDFEPLDGPHVGECVARMAPEEEIEWVAGKEVFPEDEDDDDSPV